MRLYKLLTKHSETVFASITLILNTTTNLLFAIRDFAREGKWDMHKQCTLAFFARNVAITNRFIVDPRGGGGTGKSRNKQTRNQNQTKRHFNVKGHGETPHAHLV